MFKPVNPKVSFSEIEKEILSYWKNNRIFERSIKQRTQKEFTFYDGPPFATGLPHYGHLLAGTLKDVIPRYWTMKGYRVERRFGWDCHGLPVENEKEKELGITGKKDIEAMGVGAFNEACRSIVQRYAGEWRQTVERTGRWVDMDNDYKTMDTSYMESIWWVFKQLWDKGYVYEGKKAMQICPRCVTPLSNFEVTQGYKDITDWSVIAKFPITDPDFLKKYGNGIKTSFIAWTTTPWSIPTTMGLAIGPDFDYVLVRTGEEQIIVAKNRLEYAVKSLEEGSWEVVEELKGKELTGLAYEHPYAFIYGQNEEVKNNANVYKTYATDYVSIEDGTGIVTINGAFGEIDMEAANRLELPIVINVKMDGTYTDDMGELAGHHVKPKEDPTKMDQKIAEDLESRGFLFRREKYLHSYPHCWRCDTPLLNYATTSWFVSVTKLKEKLLKNNDKTSWVPDNIKYGRFGKWLENARDWAISRNRYWGSVMPVWKCDSCEKVEVLGSLEDLRAKVPERMTKLILMRHGESETNVKTEVWSKDDRYPLTENGQKEIHTLAADLEHYDVMLVSPVLRARQSADILKQKYGTDYAVVEQLRENNMGTWEGLPAAEHLEQLKKYHELPLQERYQARMGGGENWVDIEARVSEFLKNTLSQYRGKTVAIVTHKSIIVTLHKQLSDWTLNRFFAIDEGAEWLNKSVIYVDNETGKEFDLHKHVVDEITFKCSPPDKGELEGGSHCSGTMRRIPEVLDCWFESGSMPYAQVHYPFENKEKFEQNFPADFIAEGQDQTRGWFYTLMVLSTALFDQPAFKNVIVNGVILAEDGKKMSKRLKNYPDPAYMLDTYGADAMRFYLMNSPAVQAQDLRFSEKGVDEVVKSILLPFWNAYSFFVTYANIDGWDSNGQRSVISKQQGKADSRQLTADSYDPQLFSNKLDQWILSELQATVELVTQRLDKYDLSGATEPLAAFIDGLTNWYIRRSRRRFWKSENDTDKNEAYTALYTVLVTFSQLLAPFVPFISEEIYRSLTGEDSVHLTDWPQVNRNLLNVSLNTEIDLVRTVVTLGLSLRAKNKAKVRQPLSKLQVVVPEHLRGVVTAYHDVIAEELNVKVVDLLHDSSEISVKMIKPIGALVGPKFGKDAQAVITNAKTGNFREASGQRSAISDQEGPEKSPLERGGPEGRGVSLEGTNDSSQDTSRNPGLIVFDGQGKEWELLSNEYEVVYSGKEGFDAASNQGVVVSLDLHVTEELRLEGLARDLVRAIQDMRKETNYQVSDRIRISLQGVDPQVLAQFQEYIVSETLCSKLEEKLENPDLEREIELEGEKVLVGIKR